jgi:hypothetical protein
MNYFKPLIITTSIAAILSGCAAPTESEKKAEVDQKITQQKADKVDEVISNVPDWYLNPPASDDVGFYAAGTGVSSTLDMAMTKARIKSEFEVAKKYRQIVSGNERSYTSEASNTATDTSNVVSVTEQTIDKLVAEVNLGDYTIKDTKVLREGTKYRVYLLTHMTYDTNNDGQDDLIRDVRNQAGEAFDNLERRVDKVKSATLTEVPSQLESVEQ